MNQTRTENKHVAELDLRLFDIGAETADSHGIEVGTEFKASEPGFRDRRKGAAERERMARAALHGTGDFSTKAVENAQNTTAPDSLSGVAADYDRKGENPVKSVERVEISANSAGGSDMGTAKTDGEIRLDELMKDPDFRRAFSEKAQAMIDQRFKEFKNLQKKYEALSPVIEALSSKYGTAKGDIGALVQALGNDSEMSAVYDKSSENSVNPDSHDISADSQRLLRNERDFEAEARIRSREAAKRIRAEAFAVRELYSDFELKTALADSKIREMLKSGVSLKAAYEAANIDKILRQRTALAEQKVLENIKARTDRPIEGGANAQSGAVAQNLASRLTRSEREKLAQRAIRGERISL